MLKMSDESGLPSFSIGDDESPIEKIIGLPNGKKTKGRVKIKMEYIGNKLRRYTTFSKRKTGIMKKAYELSTLTGTQVMLLVASETGHVYAFATNKLKPMIASDAGRGLIQSCLNTPDEAVADIGTCKTEFTFEPPSGCMSGSARKRKMQDTESLCLPTMVSSGSTHSTSPLNVEDYCDSDNDSDTNESPDTVMESFEDSVKSPIPPAADPQLLQKTLKDALRAASLQRQNVMQKKPRTTPIPQKNLSQSSKSRSSQGSSSDISNANLEQLSSLLPFMLQGLSGANIKEDFKEEINTDGSNRILYQMPQGVVYAPKSEENGNSDSESGANVSNPFLNQSSNNNSNEDNPLAQFLQFSNIQQLLATAALSQLAEAQASLKG
jgi:hypothetical protein